jgi:hypothetical protein
MTSANETPPPLGVNLRLNLGDSSYLIDTVTELHMGSSGIGSACRTCGHQELKKDTWNGYVETEHAGYQKIDSWENLK